MTRDDVLEVLEFVGSVALIVSVFWIVPLAVYVCGGAR